MQTVLLVAHWKTQGDTLWLGAGPDEVPVPWAQAEAAKRAARTIFLTNIIVAVRRGWKEITGKTVRLGHQQK